MIKVFHLLFAGQLILLFMLKLSDGSTEVLLDYSLPLVDNDTEFADFTHMKVVHYNRTLKVYAGNVTYFVDVDDNYQIETLLFKSIGNHYERLPYKFKRQNFCEHVNNSTDYDYIRTRSNIPAKGVCPWPKVHSLVGEYVDVSITKGEAINTTGDFGDLTGVKVRKVNRKHVISGDFHYKKGLSNDQQCKVLFYKKQGGEYRLLSYKIPAQGCCDFYNSDNFIVPELAKVCKKCPKQEDKVCPWPGAVGYLDVTVTRGEVMKGDSSYIDFSQLKVKKINREHVIIGNGTFLKDIGNDVQCKILLSKKQGGEYRLTQFKIPVKGFCDFWDTETFLVPDLQNSCELCPMQDEKHCPWKAAAGYLDVSVTRGEVLIGDSIYADYSQVKVKKINREHVLIGNATFLKEIGNDVQCKILLYKKQGGEYRLTQFKIPVKGFCDFYNTETLIVPDLENYCELCPKQKDDHCPWKAQSYFINGFKLTGRNVPPFFEGEYMGSVQFIKDDVILAGYNVYATVIR
ncbi:unnamed protein product [Diamesa tonsa]